uniref:ANK_REP_REGION domain-containing protein n=1 Tax=Caenorhabditis tropicalis TaxID=1561998 RepID=A0A1I7V1B1_9PELO
MELLNGSRQFPSKTVLHLVAAFDYDRLFEVLVDLGRKIPECRELSLFSRDQDGSTPLHTAFKHGASRTARLIMSIDGNAINVMDDRGRTPADVAPDSLLDVVEKNNEEERVNATELWVMTNGNPFSSDLGNISRTPIAERTDDFLREATSSYSIMSYEGPLQAGNSRECDEDCESCCDPSGTEQLHVEIAMDTDVHVPDSPKMARLFQAVTSPGIVVTPNARARMADLARQIIEALPDRIKRSSEVPDDDNPGGQEVFYPNCDHLVDEYIEMMTERPQETSEAARSAQLFASNFFDDRSFASSSTRANTFESDTLDFDKDLGEFFTHHVDRFVDPIQQRLANLKYNAMVTAI